jgi:hypothetical protein
MARAGAILRTTVRTAGELSVTSAVVTALFIVYQLFYSNVVGRQEMSDEVSTMLTSRRTIGAAPPEAIHPP